MRIKKTIFELLKSSCIIFTVVSLIMISLSDAVHTKATTNPSISKSLWQFFAFSILLAAANLILKSQKLSAPARLGIHFIACAVLYFFTIVVIGQKIASGTQTIVAMMIFLIVYFIFAAVYLITNSIKKQKRIKSEKYESMFR
ncbi:MAG: DUF3021 domain-containing protein [Ruminococcaceae bacterium]|nr:DUF3021 domain-containing protein [Oscillospiraceae bacterium]